MYVLNRYMYVLPFTRLGHLFFLQSFPVVLTLIHVGSITSVDWYRGSSNVQETQETHTVKVGAQVSLLSKRWHKMCVPSGSNRGNLNGFNVFLFAGKQFLFNIKDIP